MTNRQVRGGMTLHERALTLDTNDVKGRFAKEEASTVSVAHPSAGPWAPGPGPGPEPPLGIAVGAPPPPVGEAWELEAHAARAAAFAECEQKHSGQNTEKIDELQLVVNRNPALRRF